MHESSNWSQQTKGIYSIRVTWLTRDTTEIWIAYVNLHVACDLVLKELSLISFISAKGLHFPALVWPLTVRYSVVCAPPGAHYGYNVGWFETSKERINHEKQFSFRTEQSDPHKQLRSRLFLFVFVSLSSCWFPNQTGKITVRCMESTTSAKRWYTEIDFCDLVDIVQYSTTLLFQWGNLFGSSKHNKRLYVPYTEDYLGYRV